MLRPVIYISSTFWSFFILRLCKRLS